MIMVEIAKTRRILSSPTVSQRYSFYMSPLVHARVRNISNIEQIALEGPYLRE